MTTTKDEEALELARMHYQIETGMTQIFRIKGPADSEAGADEPIKLLEVNENTVPAGVMPIQFGPSPASGLSFSSIIIEVTPDEFQKIQDHELALPHGWRIGDPIPKPTAEPGG